MKLTALWKVGYKKEIEHAIMAHLIGNEGMARVCARRAAGIIIGEYLNRLGYSNLTHSAYSRLSLFTTLPSVDQKYKDIANHFLVKVNLERKLPLEADLISEVMWLEKSLLGDNPIDYAHPSDHQQ
jgi:hypothetical protein